MELKWAFGFRSFDTRNNLYWNQSGKAVYCTAGVGIVHDFIAKNMEFFNEHHEDIVSLAYHPGTGGGRSLVATG
jgi:hypothetical protein